MLWRGQALWAEPWWRNALCFPLLCPQTVEAAYGLVQDQLREGLVALREECSASAKQQEALIRSDMDQIISSRAFLEGKLQGMSTLQHKPWLWVRCVCVCNEEPSCSGEQESQCTLPQVSVLFSLGSLIFLITLPFFFMLFFLLPASRIGRGEEKWQEKERKTVKLRKREFGTFSQFAPSNVNSKPRQLQTWQGGSTSR